MNFLWLVVIAAVASPLLLYLALAVFIVFERTDHD